MPVQFKNNAAKAKLSVPGALFENIHVEELPHYKKIIK